ncbi:MAG: CoA transferase [Myxococcales bacterium]|nr:CoA transferase [Myxococcales bacterium]
MAGPLEGIKVVDVSAVLSGPLCTMMLADQGADVVKVETHGIGDTLRLPNFPRGGLTSFYMNANRNKRSLVVDLRQDEGREIVHKLVRDADVFVQNWRPGAAERLGLGESDLRAIQPELIYCSISGYGPTGPYAQRRVYDPIIQGITGHAGVQLNPEVPIRDLVRNVVSDKSSAYTAAQAITAALFARERGAGGQHVIVPMLDASLAFFWSDGMIKHTFLGEEELPGVPLYELYRLWETADGHLIYFAATDSEFTGLFRALDRPEWCEDERFNNAEARSVPENRETLGGLIMEAILTQPTQDLIERMAKEGVPVGPVLAPEQIAEDPQVIHNEAILEFEHPTAGRYQQAAPAARFDKTPQDPRRRLPPLHGEHTDEVLRELGYADADLERARSAGVIPESP